MSSNYSSGLVRNVWAVGRNYRDHAAEMKAEVPKSPFFFIKAGSTLNMGPRIQLPDWSTDVQHELELALWLDENLKYSHLTLALDLTARDAQTEAKQKGLPWCKAKSFKGSCPIGSWLSLHEYPMLKAVLNSEAGKPTDLNFQLLKNKNTVQNGHPEDMVFNPNLLLADLKKHFPVTSHDIVLTGTPAGVGPLHPGDALEARLLHNGHVLLSCLWDVV